MSKEQEEPRPVESEGYTQREWDRIVGIGKVPDEYTKRLNSYEEKRRRYEKG